MAASVFSSLPPCPVAPTLVDPRRIPRDEEQKSWSRLPSQWILDGGLRPFRDQPAFIGRSTAALKLLLTVAVMAEDAPDAVAGPHQGTASLSYDDLGRLAGLSRPLIALAKKLLCAQGLIRISQEGRGQQVRYGLESYGHGERWARIPLQAAPSATAFARIDALRRLSCRHLDDLNALKLYLALCARSEGGEGDVLADLQVMGACTNISATKLGLAFDKLALDGFLTPTGETTYRLGAVR